MKSLRRRLNGGLTMILIAVFAAQWSVGNYAIRRVVENEMLTRLEHDGDSLMASLSIDKNGMITFEPLRLGLIYEQEFSGHYFIVLHEGRAFQSKSFGDTAIPVEMLPPGQRQRYYSAGPQNQPLLTLSRGFSMDGRNITLWISEELTAIEHEIMELSLAYLLLTASMLLAAIFLQTFDVRRALRPLAAVRRELLAIGQGEASRIETDVPAEIRPLVNEINWLLMMMEHRLQQSRTAVGNLAHALKTPLAVLYRKADDSRLEAVPNIAGELREQCDTIQTRIDRELKRARLAGSAGSGSHFNPQEDISVICHILPNIYPEKNLDIQLIAPNRLIPFDREDLLEIIGNLADNACKWAVNKVLIRVEYQNGVSISVEDNGPGCLPDQMEHLTRRGLRLDESKSGHGLGLSIVNDIAQFYGGNIALGRSSLLGGFSVRVFLPMSNAAL